MKPDKMSSLRSFAANTKVCHCLTVLNTSSGPAGLGKKYNKARKSVKNLPASLSIGATATGCLIDWSANHWVVIKMGVPCRNHTVSK